jgi:Zn finger protein HypA/HybF involved in hydrogenase expression
MKRLKKKVNKKKRNYICMNCGNKYSSEKRSCKVFCPKCKSNYYHFNTNLN